MNTFGRLFRVSIMGESHQQIVGVLLDGVKSGIKITKEDFYDDLARRKPGKKGTTARVESDEVSIMCGVFNDFTTGSPVLLTFNNNNISSKDYQKFLDIPRPGHADYTAKVKYNNYNDFRGGGAFSGRLTTGLVCAGVIAKKMTNDFVYESDIINLGGETNKDKFNEVIDKAIINKDSVGGIVQITIKNVPAGLGEPFFDSVESYLSHLLFSVGAVKGVEFGTGFSGVSLYGSEFNDCFTNESAKTKTNNNGGINGGITNSNDIVIKVFVKPTPSIFKPQQTFNFKENKMDELLIEGRHDYAIVLRAAVVLEAVVACGLCDLFLIDKAYR